MIGLLEDVTTITLNDDSLLEVLFCTGLNFTDGVPSDYGVRLEDGRALIVPRSSVKYLGLHSTFVFSKERAA